jgi:hypothetical protein
MMEDSLTTDEYDALEQLGAERKSVRLSACVARNAKRLSGLKYVTYMKDGSLALTEKGTQTLFVKNCIDGLRSVSGDCHTPLDATIATFLCKKGHIVSQGAEGGFSLTQRGRETLIDIDGSDPTK